MVLVMTLHDLMTSRALKAYRDFVYKSLEDIDSDFIESNSIDFISRGYEVAFIDTTELLMSFYNDDLSPKNESVYEELCSDLIVGGHFGDLFCYEEMIDYNNFLKDCNSGDIMTFTLLALSEHIRLRSMVCRGITFGLIYITYPKGKLVWSYEADITLHDYYPLVCGLTNRSLQSLFDGDLKSVKNLFTFKDGITMTCSDKSLATLAMANVGVVNMLPGVIFYDNNQKLNTNNFKTSDSAFLRFLYNITRDEIELNSIPNIKAIFDNLKIMMINKVPSGTLKSWLQTFMTYSPFDVRFVISYLKRLAAINNECLKNEKDLVDITFDYDGQNLFEIYAKKSA